MLNEILKTQLKIIKPSDEELKSIKILAETLILKLNKNLKGKASAFVGGSLAKHTLIKKKRYDIDIFVRFSDKFKGKSKEMSDELEKAIKKISKYKRVHGSRDYFHIILSTNTIKKDILFEIVPVLSIKRAKDAENVTDLSFFHVKYVEKKLSEKLADDIRIAKSFCYSQGFYGAESHIRGFSGYALELLVIYYKGFLNFIKKTASLAGDKKIIIDPEKYYKNSSEVLMNLNESKLQSPIIFVDPTFKERNVAASLSEESFAKFIESCKKFLKKPSIDFFDEKEIDKNEYADIAKKKKAEFKVVNASINENIESIAASKLFKMFNFIVYKMKKLNFKIFKAEWEFIPSNKAKFYFIFKIPKDKVLINGPPIEMGEHVKRFKKEHNKNFVKNKKIYAYSNPLKDVNGLIKLINSELNSKKIILSVS